MREAHGHADDDAGDRRRLVNWGELLATCFASALATVVLSRLGVAGTIVGAAVTPLIITLTSTALSREAGRARQAAGQIARGDERGSGPDRERRRRLSAALATAAAATGILVASIGFAGVISDEPVSEWGRGGGPQSSPGDGSQGRESPTPAATPERTGTPAARPSATATTSPTPTPAPAEPATPTPTPTTPSASPTAAPSPAAQP